MSDAKTWYPGSSFPPSIPGVESDVAADTRPNPFFEVRPGTGLGAYVRTTVHGHVGRVFKVHYNCPESPTWQAMQAYDVQAAASETKRWVSILVHDGGSVVVPETMVEPVEPFELKNDSAIFYFGEGTR